MTYCHLIQDVLESSAITSSHGSFLKQAQPPDSSRWCLTQSAILFFRAWATRRFLIMVVLAIKCSFVSGLFWGTSGLKRGLSNFTKRVCSFAWTFDWAIKILVVIRKWTRHVKTFLHLLNVYHGMNYFWLCLYNFTLKKDRSSYYYTLKVFPSPNAAAQVAVGKLQRVAFAIATSETRQGDWCLKTMSCFFMPLITIDGIGRMGVIGGATKEKMVRCCHRYLNLMTLYVTMNYFCS